jgi:hypothetical protein
MTHNLSALGSTNETVECSAKCSIYITPHSDNIDDRETERQKEAEVVCRVCSRPARTTRPPVPRTLGLSLLLYSLSSTHRRPRPLASHEASANQGSRGKSPPNWIHLYPGTPAQHSRCLCLIWGSQVQVIRLSCSPWRLWDCRHTRSPHSPFSQRHFFNLPSHLMVITISRQLTRKSPFSISVLGFLLLWRDTMTTAALTKENI